MEEHLRTFARHASTKDWNEGVYPRHCLASPNRAPKARNMKARGKREAKRSASPLVTRNNLNRALKVRNINRNLFRSFRSSTFIAFAYQGRRASRLPLAFIFRAFGARFVFIFAFGARFVFIFAFGARFVFIFAFGAAWTTTTIELEHGATMQ